eukprot:COSAG04_NODE_107_length_25959_cov_6.617865_19_plen_62_part_00
MERRSGSGSHGDGSAPLNGSDQNTEHRQAGEGRTASSSGSYLAGDLVRRAERRVATILAGR